MTSKCCANEFQEKATGAKSSSPACSGMAFDSIRHFFTDPICLLGLSTILQVRTFEDVKGQAVCCKVDHRSGRPCEANWRLLITLLLSMLSFLPGWARLFRLHCPGSTSQNIVLEQRQDALRIHTSCLAARKRRRSRETAAACKCATLVARSRKTD
eukprot:TRINITY_DN7013_c0_g2_i1.p1 TRINITY_DN7013_c0_g2~~TRINITY_DN7013_c0_g2_i1.p1  ORF type:complete len:156 (-),score=16.47 TRINITY_DN7013_c0_g2_i1:8-475(-)